MSNAFKIAIAVSVLAVLGFAALHTGLARWAFFELFAYVKGVDVLSPTVVREPPVDSPYQRWLEQARGEIPVREALVIDDVNEAPLQPWPRLGNGVTGLYLRFADYQVTDGRIVEIPAGGETVPLRALYEQGLYIIAGSGHTLLQHERAEPTRVPWKAGDLFSIPLNVPHQHFSEAGAAARILLVTSFPLMLNLLAEETALYRIDYAFEDRYDGGPDYFLPQGEPGNIQLMTNFAEGIPRTDLVPWDYRGKGNTALGWIMAGNSTLHMHVSEMPPRMYKKAHRHSTDAFILLLSGRGFSVTWPESRYDKRERVDWRAGTLFTPPTYWYHQHLNTGDEPARYLAISPPLLIRNLGLRFIDQLEVDLEDVEQEWKAEIEQRQ